MIGTGHLWIILGLLLIVLIVYGPGKLPEVGGAIGRGINEFRKSSGVVKDTNAAAPPAPERTDQSRGAPTTEDEASVSSPASPVGQRTDRT